MAEITPATMSPGRAAYAVRTIERTYTIKPQKP
jgi:hypothetical protein